MTRLVWLLAVCWLAASCASQQVAESPIPERNNDLAAVSDASEDGDWIIVSSVAVKKKPKVGSLIARFRKNFSWNYLHVHDKRVQYEISLMEDNQTYINDTFKGALRYLRFIDDKVKERGMPPELAFLPAVESQYKPFAYSFAHAAGMWQIIPSTGKILGLNINWWQDQRRDLVASTDAALNYLEKLVNRFNGNWLHALAAYNAGPLRVERAINKNKKRGKSTDYWSLSLPRETRRYVPRLIAFVEIVSNPTKYNVKIPDIADEPVFTSIDVDRQIDMHKLAEFTGFSLDDIIAFNGSFNQRFTIPFDSYQLHIPFYMEEKVRDFLASDQSKLNEHWISYKVKRGDNLTAIAKQFNTNINVLAETNRISKSSIRAGRYLLVPVQEEDFTVYARYHDKEPDRVVKRIGTSERYRLKKGDSLWKLAKQFRVSINDLMRWNSINKSTTLFAGKSIYIRRAAYIREEPIQLQPSLEYTILSKVYYPIRSGDTLSAIANRFNVKRNDIIAWNPRVIKKGVLPAKKTIVLHVDVTKTY